MTNFSLNNYSDYDDTKLVQLSVDGDKKALQALIVRHQLFVYNLALKMVGNVQDAEDLTQEVFIKMITALSCLLYTSPSPRDGLLSRMPSSA